MPPTTPYVTGDLASLLAKNLFRGQTPSFSTAVTDMEMDQLILWTDSMLNMDFFSVGYKVPFLTLSGETWPAHQTTFLQFMSAVGAMAMASGYILAPAPAMHTGRVSGERNVWAVLIEGWRQGIHENGFHFRAQHYIGSKAEQWLATPYGPDTDFIRDKWDPTRFELLRDWTDRITDVHSDIQGLDIDWDYLYSLR